MNDPPYPCGIAAGYARKGIAPIQVQETESVFLVDLKETLAYEKAGS